MIASAEWSVLRSKSHQQITSEEDHKALSISLFSLFDEQLLLFETL